MDGEVSLISTFNLDYISSYVNSEVGTLIWSKDFASRITDMYAGDQIDPRNKVVEYKIKKDKDGHAILKDGEPIVEFGAKDHLSAADWEKYKVLRGGAKAARPLL